MELDAIDGLAIVRKSSVWGGIGVAYDMEVCWRFRELVSVRHPDLRQEFRLGING